MNYNQAFTSLKVTVIAMIRGVLRGGGWLGCSQGPPISKVVNKIIDTLRGCMIDEFDRLRWGPYPNKPP